MNMYEYMYICMYMYICIYEYMNVYIHAKKVYTYIPQTSRCKNKNNSKNLSPLEE